VRCDLLAGGAPNPPVISFWNSSNVKAALANAEVRAISCPWDGCRQTDKL